jgi:hypothetical protein
VRARGGRLLGQLPSAARYFGFGDDRYVVSFLRLHDRVQETLTRRSASRRVLRWCFILTHIATVWCCSRSSGVTLSIALQCVVGARRADCPVARMRRRPRQRSRWLAGLLHHHRPRQSPSPVISASGCSSRPVTVVSRLPGRHQRRSGQRSRVRLNVAVSDGLTCATWPVSFVTCARSLAVVISGATCATQPDPTTLFGRFLVAVRPSVATAPLSRRSSARRACGCRYHHLRVCVSVISVALATFTPNHRLSPYDCVVWMRRSPAQRSR